MKSAIKPKGELGRETVVGRVLMAVNFDSWGYSHEYVMLHGKRTLQM